MFATHYHELAQLAESLPGLRNYNVEVKEMEDDVIFLHKIAPGSAERSYGIHVARLAGVPKPVLERATGILTELEARHKLPDAGRKPVVDPPERRKRKAKADDGLGLFGSRRRAALKGQTKAWQRPGGPTRSNDTAPARPSPPGALPCFYPLRGDGPSTEGVLRSNRRSR